MVEMAGSEVFSQNGSQEIPPAEEKKEYTIEELVGKLKDGQTLASEELVWFSKQIANGSIDWGDGIDNSWTKELLPQLKAEMEKSVKEGETSRDLRDSERGELFTVSQVQRRARGKGGQLGYQEWKQNDAKNAIKEADVTLSAQKALEHMKIKKELPEGVKLDDLIKEQREATKISGWRHPMKKFRSHRTLRNLEKLQLKTLTSGTEGKGDVTSFLDSVSNGGVKTPSLWARVRHPFQSREQSKDLNELLDKLPSSELTAGGKLMTGIEAEIKRLETTMGPDKRKNKETKKKIKKLQNFKQRITAKTKKRDAEFSKSENELKAKHSKHRTTAAKRFETSAKVTKNRDELLQATTLFSKTLQSLEEQGVDVSEIREQYRKQIETRDLEELPPTASQDEVENATKDPDPKKVRSAGQASDDNTEPPADGEEAEEEKDAATVEAQKDGEDYAPLKDVKYTRQVDGQQTEETYQGDAISHSAEEDRYSIDLSKAQGEELDKACMATLAHIKNGGKDSFRIDENTPVELYDALVKAAEASGMTIENGKELKEIMDKKREGQQDENNGEKPKEGEERDASKNKDEPALTPEQRHYLMDNGHVDGMKVEDINKLKWSDLNKAQQELLTRDGLGPKEGEKPSRTQEQPQSEKTEPQTEQEKLLAKSEALKGIRSSVGTFDQETQRYKISSEADFQEKIADLSPAEQRAAREIRGLQVKENMARDKAEKSGEPFDKKKEEEFARSQGGAWGRAYEAIKKERGVTDPKKEVKQTTLDPKTINRDKQNS